MAHEFRYLFTPLRVGGLTLKNRIFSTAHAEAMAEDGKPGPRLSAYHEAKARGGAALTIIGGSTERASLVARVRLEHDRESRRVDRARLSRHRGRGPSARLPHHEPAHAPGRRAQSDVEGMHVLLAPSQIPEKVHREVPHEMEHDHIAMLVRAFGDAARRCREGGLDGVELSFAHNHLVDQFWSPLFNRRTDEYGGSLENRLRFGFEVLREVRRQVGSDWVVGARISGDELTDGGLSADDMADIARRLAASGLVDFLSIVGGAAHTAAHQAAVVPNMAYPIGLYVPIAAAIKAAVPEIGDPARDPHRRSRPCRPDSRRRRDRSGRDDPRAHRGSRAAEEGAGEPARGHPRLRRGQRGLHRSHLPGQARDVRPESGRGPRGRADGAGPRRGDAEARRRRGRGRRRARGGARRRDCAVTG